MRLAATGRVERRAIEGDRRTIDAHHQRVELAHIDVTQVHEIGVTLEFSHATVSPIPWDGFDSARRWPS